MQKRIIHTLPKDTEITGKVLADLIKSHKEDKPVFNRLESYVDDAPEMERDTPNELLTIHNFAEYIRDTNVGYLLGHPVDYKANDKTSIDVVVDKYRQQSISELDSDIAEDLSMFGQAFENVFIDETTNVLSAKLSVYNTIVVYDTTFKHDKLFAVYYAPKLDDKSTVINDRYDVTVWTATNTITGDLNKEAWIEESNEPHFFKEVPVIHYMNNKRMKGDYEAVISLIDAYNILQSDRVIDREKLVDAILAFYGAKLTAEDARAIKENRTIGLPEGAKAEYLIKSINEADTDVLRKTIAADIHKFSKTPDFTDEKFGSAPSGVSLKYKILSLEWNAQKKERQFAAGLMDRFRIYSTILTTQSKMTAIDLSVIDPVFRRSLPKNDFETSQMINNLDGTVDQETLVGQLSFVQDASAVVKKVNAEKDANLQRAGFGTDNFEKEGEE